MERKKIVHQLDAPYSTVQWPQISQEDQNVILELLCSLLSPLGIYRKSHIPVSKGKRESRKRKKQDGVEDKKAVPPAPKLAAYVDVGLSSISSHIQMMTAKSGDPAATVDTKVSSADPPDEEKSLPYAVIFVARSGQPSAFHSHFPEMVALASRSQPAGQPVRLVGFSKACEDRLAACLGIPRASSIAIRSGAPQAKALFDYIADHVPVVDVAWLREATSGHYIETKVNAVDTPVGQKKQKTSQSGKP